MSFIRRRGGRPDDQRVAEALRASLRSHAGRAPRGGDLAERILAAVDEPAPAPLPHRRARFAGWAPPLVAAASVAAVAAVVVGLAGLGGGSHPVATGHGPGGTTHAAASGHASPSPAPPVSRSVASSPAVPTSAAPTGGQLTTPLRGVRILDVTFAGTNDGWALGSADCLSGPGRCTALLRTHDGRHWTPMAGAAFNVPGGNVCQDPCVEHLRFADDSVGYAFGDKALFMTTDGGKSWQRQPGGALALETLDGNVIRITSPHSGCPGPCDVGVETAPVGSAHWTQTVAPGGFRADNQVAGVQFARSPTDAYLLLQANPAGGAPNQTSTLFRSVDSGATWQSVGEPCSQRGGENDSVAIAAGADGDLSVLCRRRLDSNRSQVITSTDAGATFDRTTGALPFQWAATVTGDPKTVLIAVADAGPWARSTDGGQTWHLITGVSPSISFVGFESPTVGRAIAADGRQLWTTRDGGRTWHRAVLG